MGSLSSKINGRIGSRIGSRKYTTNTETGDKGKKQYLIKLTSFAAALEPSRINDLASKLNKKDYGKHTKIVFLHWFELLEISGG